MEHQAIIEIQKAIGEGRYPLLLETRDGEAIERPYKLTESTRAEVFCGLIRLTQIEVDTALEAWGRDYPRGGYHYTFAGDRGELIQVAIPAPHKY
nr:MAG TPA: hypothetical protein [Caudoviricetes sp.]